MFCERDLSAFICFRNLLTSGFGCYITYLKVDMKFCSGHPLLEIEMEHLYLWPYAYVNPYLSQGLLFLLLVRQMPVHIVFSDTVFSSHLPLRCPCHNQSGLRTPLPFRVCLRPFALTDMWLHLIGLIGISSWWHEE